MEVRAFFPAEFIIRRQTGFIDILGFGLSNLDVESLPVSLTVHVLCQIQFSPAETGEHRLQIAFLSPDGERLSDLRIDVPTGPKEGASGFTMHGPFPLNVKKTGPHAIVGVLDGREFAQWPIAVRTRGKASSET